MENTEQKLNDELYYDRAISLALRIGFMGLLLIMAYLILRPFLFPIAWGIIIAVGIHPLHRKLASALGNREKLAAILITLIAILLLVIPSILLTDSTIDSVQNLAVKFEEGSLVVPPVPAEVADWPIIGQTLYDTWNLATVNLEDFLVKIAPQLQSLAPKLFSAVAGLVTTILLSIVSIIIAGLFLVKAKSSEQAARKMFKVLIGKQGKDFTQLAGATIRSVVQGVLGVAIIQALVSGIGMLLFDIPAAGLWAIIVLFLAVIQLPPILILAPVAAYAFTIMDTTPAVIFLIFSIIVSGSDAFLKPLFLGRGVDVPMLVILLGAIGGMMLGGIIGLFVGAVILALAYKVYQALITE
jgi:predicted PurR-regulated permease PerM